MMSNKKTAPQKEVLFELPQMAVPRDFLTFFEIKLGAVFGNGGGRGRPRQSPQSWTGPCGL